MSDRGDMPRAAILLALLLLIVSTARPQGPQAPQAPVVPPGSVALSAPPVLVFSGSAATDFFRPGLPATDTISPDTPDRPRDGKSSWTAIGLSAALPGAGQVYTANYWKVPLIWGLGGYWVYEWSSNNKLYREHRDRYNQSIVDSPPGGDERYLRLREFYRDQRDSFAWYLGLLYFLNVVDAYVGAELYDFDVGPDLGAGGDGMHATLRIHL